MGRAMQGGPTSGTRGGGNRQLGNALYIEDAWRGLHAGVQAAAFGEERRLASDVDASVDC
jgi:hypothetical protein